MIKQKIEYWKIDRFIKYINNPRINDPAVDRMISAIHEFGFRVPCVVKSDGTLVDGHLRLKAAKKLNLKEIPVLLADDLTEAQIKAFRISVNQISNLADWDIDLLKIEVEGLQELDFDIDLLGFDDDFMGDLLAPEDNEGLTDEDAVPDVPEEAITKRGDIWKLGNHRLMCGDSTMIDDVEKLMVGQKALLIHADPPYGMGKESDGVLNDNLYNSKLDDFQFDWWSCFRMFLEDNGSAYIWGTAPDLWRLWYDKIMPSERLTLRNEIVWDKGHGQGMTAEEFRSFPLASERCLFFMVGEQGFNNNADNYFEGFEPIRAYLKNERDSIGWTNKIVADFFGFHPRMADHWFSRSQWSFPQKEQYERLQKEANNEAFNREYEDLKREYEDLKREFYGTRAYFNNSHDSMTDVWEFKRVQGSERHDHATPKPVAMMARIMNSSLPPKGLCVEPFGGSGSTLMSAEKTNRVCYTMELQPFYCDVVIKRWENYTGNTAMLIETNQFEVSNG